MPNNPEDLEKEIKPLNKKEVVQISNIFSQLAIGTQAFANAAQRHALNHYGILSFYKDKDPQTKNSQAKTSAVGDFSARLLYQGVAIYPSLLIGRAFSDNLKDNPNLPKFFIDYFPTIAATTFETAAGTPLEVRSSFRSLRSVGINISTKDLLSASKKTFVPFWFRNVLTWWAIDGDRNDLVDYDENKLIKKAARGAFAGFLSTPLQNIGLMTTENSLNKSWGETASAVFEGIKKQPNLFRGALPRSTAIAATSVILSQPTTDLLVDAYKKFFGATEPQPSPSPIKRSSVKTDITPKQGRDK